MNCLSRAQSCQMSNDIDRARTAAESASAYHHNADDWNLPSFNFRETNHFQMKHELNGYFDAGTWDSGLSTMQHRDLKADVDPRNPTWPSTGLCL